MGLFTQHNDDLIPAGTQRSDQYGRTVVGGPLEAFLSGASSTPGTYIDRETGKSFTSERAMREYQWKHARGLA